MLRQQLEWYSNNANYRLIYARCGNIFRDTTCSLVMSINISNATVRSIVISIRLVIRNSDIIEISTRCEFPAQRTINPRNRSFKLLSQLIS